jgi:ribonuclease P protein subunit POP4
MTATPETLVRHELNGRRVSVVESTDPSRVGIAGRVVSETMRTIVVRDSGVERRVPKSGTTFAFAIDEAAGAERVPGTASELPRDTAGETGQSGGCEGAAYVTVDGDRLLSRPARRTERGVSRWR